MTNPNLIIDQDITVPFEDLFKGGYEAHKVPDMEKTYTITKAEAREKVESNSDITKEKLETLIGMALGEASGIFMNQEVKGTEIVMPADELVIIRDNLVSDILKEVKEDK